MDVVAFKIFASGQSKMDSKLFGANSPGELIGISHGDVAFVPDVLPPKWKFPLRLWPLLAEARQQIGILEGLGRNLPNLGLLLRPLEDREAIKSSSLEGTYATPQELLLFELEPRASRSENDPINDHLEVYNYRTALLYGMSTELPISLRLIRDLHRKLMDGVRGKDQTPGEFRRVQVAIGSTRRFIPPPPDRVAECLKSLEQYIHHSQATWDSLIDCFLVHYQFETIHPFMDGNGRVGRLLLALMLQKKCHLSKPWLYLSEYYEKYRDEYVRCLLEVSTKARWGEWIEFCLNGTLEQAKNTIERCDKLIAIREKFMRQISDSGGSVRLNQIIDGIFNSPFIRVAELARILNVSYPTAKSDLERLVQVGILAELDGASPKTFYAPEVFRVSYEF